MYYRVARIVTYSISCKHLHRLPTTYIIVIMDLIYIFDDMMVMFCVFLQDGWNALHCAALGGHVNVVDWLCTKYPNMTTKTSNVSKHKI